MMSHLRFCTLGRMAQDKAYSMPFLTVVAVMTVYAVAVVLGWKIVWHVGLNHLSGRCIKADHTAADYLW